MTDTCTFLIYRWNDEGGCQQAGSFKHCAADPSYATQQAFPFICPAPMPSFPKA